jgi:hypothetical protein
MQTLQTIFYISAIVSMWGLLAEIIKLKAHVKDIDSKLEVIAKKFID